MHANFTSNDEHLGRHWQCHHKTEWTKLNAISEFPFPHCTNTLIIIIRTEQQVGRRQRDPMKIILFFIFGEQQRLCHLIFLILTRLWHQTTLYIQCFASFFFFPRMKLHIFLLRCSAILGLWQLHPYTTVVVARWMRPTSERSCHARHFAPVLKFNRDESCALNEFDWTYKEIIWKSEILEVVRKMTIGSGREFFYIVFL